MPKGLECLGSPDRTTFATFVWMRKLKKFIISWKKSLKYVRKLNRQNLHYRSSAYVIVWLPLLGRFRTFNWNIAIENIRLNQLILQY